MTRADRLADIQRKFDAAVGVAETADEAGLQGPHVLGPLLGTVIGLFGRLLSEVADLDAEVSTLRKEVKRLKQAAK